MLQRTLLAALFVLAAAAPLASQPSRAQAAPPSTAAPDRKALAEAEARRFPQPVRVGDLVGRRLLEPRESQPLLGHVERLVRTPEGLDIVVRQAGLLARVSNGLVGGGRRVAVPAEAISLLGEHVALTGLSPAQFAALPDAAPAAPIPPDQVVRLGLVKPFH